MKQETLISMTILTVVTAVVIGVWTEGFGLLKHASVARFVNPETVGAAAWSGGVSQTGTRAPLPQLALPQLNVVNGFPAPGQATGGLLPVAAPVAGGAAVEGAVEAVAPKPPNFIPDAVQLFEAHWQGMDTRLLTAELRRKLRFPQGLQGILVGEVTLSAVRSGLLAGDVIVAVEGQQVTTIENFQEATRAIANQRQANLDVLRKGGAKDQAGNRSAMMRLTLVIASDRELGFAQVEGAPMIKAGDPRPHQDRGPCTQCHSIGSGFELTPDPDLITLPPPPLPREVMARGLRPHEDRGPCQACHVVTQ